MKKLPGIPEAPQEVERKTSSHPSHTSHFLQGKLSCFFLRRGYTNTPTSGWWLSFFLEDDLFFPSRQRPFVSPLPDHRERPLEAEGAGCTLGGGTVSGIAGKPGPGSRKGPPPSQVRKEAKSARHYLQPGEYKHWPWPPIGPPDLGLGNSPGERHPGPFLLRGRELRSRGYIQYWGEPGCPWRNGRIRTPNHSKQKAGRLGLGRGAGLLGATASPLLDPEGSSQAPKPAPQEGMGRLLGFPSLPPEECTPSGREFHEAAPSAPPAHAQPAIETARVTAATTQTPQVGPDRVGRDMDYSPSPGSRGEQGTPPLSSGILGYYLSSWLCS